MLVLKTDQDTLSDSVYTTHSRLLNSVNVNVEYLYYKAISSRLDQVQTNWDEGIQTPTLLNALTSSVDWAKRAVSGFVYAHSAALQVFSESQIGASGQSLLTTSDFLRGEVGNSRLTTDTRRSAFPTASNAPASVMKAQVIQSGKLSQISFPFADPTSRRFESKGYRSSLELLRFTKTIYHWINSDEEEQAIKSVLVELDSLLSDDNYELCDRILSAIEPSRIPSSVAIAFLSITLKVDRVLLPNRATFLEKVRGSIVGGKGVERTTKMLAPFE